MISLLPDQLRGHYCPARIHNGVYQNDFNLELAAEYIEKLQRGLDAALDAIDLHQAATFTAFPEDSALYETAVSIRSDLEQ